jgi:two-component system chemotaxis sensor kinase CheA
MSGDLPREEYFSEALEIVEALGRDLLALDDGLRRTGRADVELVNDLFRGVHTLKGIAGLFGPSPTTELSRRLEDVLERVRLGRAALDDDLLDLLFRAVDVYGRVLAAERVDAPPPVAELDDLLLHLEGGVAAVEPSGTEFDLDPGLVSVLTEYEEHRLRANVAEGKGLFRLLLELELAGIDVALEALKARVKGRAEIITYLPTGAGASEDTIGLDVLLASSEAPYELEPLFVDLGGKLEPVPRKPVSGVGATIPPAAIRAASPSSALAPPSGSAQGRAPLAAREEPPKAVAQTVRVDIRKLDGLMSAVGELGLVRSALARLAARLRADAPGIPVAADLARLERTFERHLGAIREGILDVRMVPLGQIFEKLQRVVRQLGRDAGKQVNVVITGGETEVDKLIVESLSDPLVHIIRNSIDHGIEPVDEREAVGKPAVGTIAVNAFQKGNHVVVEVEDDGRGIDVERLRASALSRGLVTHEEVEAANRRELLGLVFLPGATTRANVSDLSGRGVGMDVVKTNIAKLGGVVDLASDEGIGTKITITLPATLAIVKALLVRVRAELFAVPLANVEEALLVDAAEARRIDGRRVVGVRGRSLALCRLAELLELAEASGDPPPRRREHVVVVSIGAQRLGLLVDAIAGERDVVIKPLGPSLRSVRGFAGATELDDRRVALVLDTPGLVAEFFASPGGAQHVAEGVARG